MEEDPDGVECKCGSKGSEPSKKKKTRFALDQQGSGDIMMIKCSGKQCQSCTAGVIADCVALCCCPCAVVNLLALVFIRVPWIVGKRCLRIGKKKIRKCRKKRDNSDSNSSSSNNDYDNNTKGVDDNYRECIMVRDCYYGSENESRNGRISTCGFAFDFEDEMVMERFRESFDGEKAWLELYPIGIGHLSFGRVSFSGIQWK